jgi:hypothetical protein
VKIAADQSIQSGTCRTLIPGEASKCGQLEGSVSGVRHWRGMTTLVRSDEGWGRSVQASEVMPMDVLEALEDRYWQPIADNATLEAMRASGDRIDDAPSHPFLFSDHAVVHVRDIAQGVIDLAMSADGVLLPRRDGDRQEFLVSCGVALTYLHDIGMVDPTVAGRRVHPAFAAHTAFTPDFDDIVERLLSADWPVVRRLRQIEASAPFAVPLPVVLRELLSLSIAHSKTAVPPETLDDPTALRTLVRAVVLTDLEQLRLGMAPRVDAGTSAPAARWYADLDHEPYGWLTSGQPAHLELVDDVTDALRVLRSADALRQRGSSLRTSAGYEVVMEAATGEAVYAVRTADGSQLLWIRVNGVRTSGEANLRTAWLAPSGDLRVSFHRGAYVSEQARRRAVEATAFAVDDIVADVLPSFATARARYGMPAPSRDPSTMLIQVERPRDRPDFAAEVVVELLARRPHLTGRIHAVADVESADAAERARYHAASRVTADSRESAEIVDAVRRHGFNADDLDVTEAFEDVRRSVVRAGDTLVTAGSPPSFVYIPTSSGLVVHPRGGYRAEAAAAWIPIGATGVVRDAERNSDVVAHDDVDVILIPGELFARAWFKPYDSDRLHELFHRDV